jgi:hypothetical protein
MESGQVDTAQETYARWDGANAYFWVDAPSEAGLTDQRALREYHWLADCPWLRCALAHGGVLVTSPTPPANAAEGFDFGCRPSDARWLCAICNLHMPMAVAVPDDPDSQPCATCGCSREMHECCRSPFDTGCGMAYADADRGPDGSIESAWLLHCRCDGFRPMPPGRPTKRAKVGR